MDDAIPIVGVWFWIRWFLISTCLGVLFRWLLDIIRAWLIR